MRGHEPILAMRRRGVRPAHVALAMTDRRPIDWASVPELRLHADVVVAPGDVPELLDLRFVVGLPVFVTDEAGTDPRRMRRLVLAAEAAGAEWVVGTSGRFLIATHTGGQKWRN